MKQVKIPGSDLQVSSLCLGTVNFGTSLQEADAFRQFDYFFAAGGNFLDTAHVYGSWVPGYEQASEKVIGKWMKKQGNRDKVVISTKGAHPSLHAMSIPRLEEHEIRKDLEESLLALDTDYIDFYFLHRDDPSVPVENILYTLETLKKEGKIRNYGCSNWTLARLRQADEISETHSYKGFVANQILWSLCDINLSGLRDKSMVAMDMSTYDYHAKTGKAVMAYMSLAKGYASKKLHRSIIPEDLEAMYGNPSNGLLINKLIALKQKLGCASTPIMLSILMNQPFTSIPIASFSSFEQLEEACLVSTIEVSSELVEEIMNTRKFTYA